MFHCEQHDNGKPTRAWKISEDADLKIAGKSGGNPGRFGATEGALRKKEKLLREINYTIGPVVGIMEWWQAEQSAFMEAGLSETRVATPESHPDQCARRARMGQTQTRMQSRRFT